MKERIITAFVTLCLCSCEPIPLYYSGRHVKIEVDVQTVSSGYIKVSFNPSYPAYYLSGVEKVSDCHNLLKNEEYFMSVVLDSSLVEYAQWRHSHIRDGEQYISDYASHSLNYGESTMRRFLLEPDTDYWVYSFVVDPDSMKADGHLFLQPIHTASESVLGDIRFSYKISASWEYIYPINMDNGEIATDIPWVTGIIDSLDLRRRGYSAPADYFMERFMELSEDGLNVFTGIHVINNSGIGGGNEPRLENGHTYYRAMGVIDGGLNECHDIYCFRWIGSDTEINYDATDGEATTSGGLRN